MGAQWGGRRSALGAGRVGTVDALVGGWLFGILTRHATIVGADSTPDYNVSEGDKRANMP